MDVATAISLASFIIALFALFMALLQVQIQFSIDSRRKGKTDYLALGSWAISWPQTKFFIHLLLQPLGLRSPWGDPRRLTVPIITVRAIKQYLLDEARATKRKPIERRIRRRLVDSVTEELASGAPAFQRHMYAVRETTRKRSESCWADVMDMCGFERKHWSNLTQASAPGCNGVVRPANAVTNVHSLSWYARIMGLRDAAWEETRVIFYNTGAKLYYDKLNSLGPLAHFHGSPGGRYMILDEMSQATSQSLYADSVWAYGRVPLNANLEVHWPEARGKMEERGKAAQQILWPNCVPEMMDVDINGWPPAPGLGTPPDFVDWAAGLLPRLTLVPDADENSTTDISTKLDIVQFAKRRDAALVSSIRTYPLQRLNDTQARACTAALSWCVKHHWLSPYCLTRPQFTASPRAFLNIPVLPVLDCSIINCEYITGIGQAYEWCKAASSYRYARVDKGVWESCCALDPTADPRTLNRGARRILLRVLQTWKLFLLYTEMMNKDVYRDVVTALLALLTMASVALADDSEWSMLGPMEENKVVEVELG